jgi:hypothetical protein
MPVVERRVARECVIMAAAGKRNGRTGPSAEIVNVAVVKRGDAFVVVDVTPPRPLVGTRRPSLHLVAVPVVETGSGRIGMNVFRSVGEADEIDGVGVPFLPFLSQENTAFRENAVSYITCGPGENGNGRCLPHHAKSRERAEPRLRECSLGDRNAIYQQNIATMEAVRIYN